MPSLPPKIKHFSILANNSRKIEIPVLSYWEKYFVTFPQRKLSYVIFDRNHFFWLYYCFYNQLLQQVLLLQPDWTLQNWNYHSKRFKFKIVFFCTVLKERILLSVKSFIDGKLAYGENLSSVKTNCRWKYFFREKYSSLKWNFVKVFPDKVLCLTWK